MHPIEFCLEMVPPGKIFLKAPSHNDVAPCGEQIFTGAGKVLKVHAYFIRQD
jgi:hypothetical protein